jgi:hypothetical protein
VAVGGKALPIKPDQTESSPVKPSQAFETCGAKHNGPARASASPPFLTNFDQFKPKNTCP